MKRLRLEDLKDLAKKRGGVCISHEYFNARTKLAWKCGEGHQWEAVPDSVKRGTWCPKCLGRRKTIQDMRAVARARGGKCLSTQYVNQSTPLRWQCAEGHEWLAPTNRIVWRRSWCPYCSGRVGHNIKEYRMIAKERKGKCLSNQYVNATSKLLWECANGHQWEAAPCKVKGGQWCPVCAGNLRTGIKKMQILARERGGHCLSLVYVNTESKLTWECAVGHTWKAIPMAIKRGSWCPECSSSLGERLCREFFEQIFRMKFPKVRPAWLINREGFRMELDGYASSLGLAFEHQGRQHYSTKSQFYSNQLEEKDRQDLLHKRIRDDQQKTILCENRGIALVQIPEITSRLPLESVPEVIVESCRKRGIDVPEDWRTIAFSLTNAYTSQALEKLRLLQESAIARGGKCLSTQYLGSGAKIEWECKFGHRWKARAGHVLEGHWCRRCAATLNAKKLKLGIKEMKEIAGKKGGDCLSTVYIDNKTPLLWKCGLGHTWETAPSVIKHGGAWCPECKGLRKATIEQMVELARLKNGKCLSSVYQSTHSKLMWRCGNGHEWHATPSSIKSGTWCPFCSRRTKRAGIGVR